MNNKATQIWLISIICLLTLVTFKAYSQTNLYVDSSNVSPSNGTSWSTAFRSLSQALNIANTNTGKYVIHIAQGTYYPTLSNGNIVTSRDSSFLIFRKGIKLLAGYPAGGGTRNSKQFVTKMSGDIGTKGTNTDNLYHVLLVAINTNNSDSLAVDGITIEGGYANGNNIMINGVTFLGGSGGGLYINNNSGTTITNVYITNCLIQNNYASSDGGGMQNFNCTVNIFGSFFNNNISLNYGAGLNNEAGGSLILVNNIFSNNANSSFGGALRVSGSSTNHIVNCTFVNNSSPVGGAIRVASLGTATVNIYNCIFRGNRSGTDTTSTNADVSNGATLNISYSSLQSVQTCTSCLAANTNPLLSNINNPLGNDGFFGTADDGLKLTSTSPCINVGNNAIINTYATTDITGSARIQATTVDMGAYEFGPFISAVTVGSFGLLSTCDGTPVGYNSFEVSGTSLTSNLVITAPTHFQVSTSPNSGYVSSISLTPSNGNITPILIYIRLASTATGTINNNLVISSTGATSQTLPISGTAFAIPAAPTITTSTTSISAPQTNVAYSCSVVSGVSNYLWSYTGTGVDFVNGQYTTNLTVNFASNASSGNMQVVSKNGACSSTAASVFVNVTPLPSVLGSFSVDKVNNTAILNFTTLTEINSDYIGIEHSSDAFKFNILDKITAKGNSSTPTNYNFSHFNPINGINYYRLKLVDKNGKYDYSEIRKIDFSSKLSSTNIYPNPIIDGKLNIDLGEEINEAIDFSIADMQGKIVKRGLLVNRQQTIQVNDLLQGTYVLKVGSTFSTIILKK